MENENLNVEDRVVKEISYPIFSSKGWIKLLGILMLIYGVVAALSIIGIIVAWLPIWLGILLIQVSSKTELAQLTGSKEALIKAQNSLSTFFTVYGVLALIGIIGWAIFLIVFFATGLFYKIPEMIPEYY
jgi:hypothetical protein